MKNGSGYITQLGGVLAILGYLFFSWVRTSSDGSTETIGFSWPGLLLAVWVIVIGASMRRARGSVLAILTVVVGVAGVGFGLYCVNLAAAGSMVLCVVGGILGLLAESGERVEEKTNDRDEPPEPEVETTE